MSATSRSPSHCIAPAIIRKANAVMRLLHRRKLTLVTAESCTGGLIAAALSQAEGASDVLEGAFVTYTKEQKTAALGVRKDLLKREGAVTPRVAAQMAAGARGRSKAKLALSITGILGPKSDEDGNPVGLVIYAVAYGRRKPEITERRFPRLSHDQLRRLATLTALDLLRKAISGRRKRVS